MNEGIEELSKRIKELKASMESCLPFLDEQINEIIKNKDRSIKRIERVLDLLLDYAQVGVGEEQFNRLVSYYESLNKENAAFYANSIIEHSED